MLHTIAQGAPLMMRLVTLKKGQEEVHLCLNRIQLLTTTWSHQLLGPAFSRRSGWLERVKPHICGECFWKQIVSE